MGPVRQWENGHSSRRRHLLRYRESRGHALQWGMLPAAARLLQHDQQSVLVCSGNDSGGVAEVSVAPSDRLRVGPANAFQSKWCGLQFHRSGFTAERVLSLASAGRLSVELNG